jgi:hypothetical protein
LVDLDRSLQLGQQQPPATAVGTNTNPFLNRDNFGPDGPIQKVGAGYSVVIGGQTYYVQNEQRLFGSRQVVGILNKEKNTVTPLAANDPRGQQILNELKEAQVQAQIDKYQKARECGQGRTCGRFYDINQGLQAIQNWGSLSYLFMGQEERAEKMAQAAQLFDKYSSTGWAQSLCLAKIDNPPQGTAYVQLPQGQGLGVAATIYGECLRQPGIGGSETLYKIGGFVKNPAGTFAGSGVRYNIYVNGPSGKSYLFTETQELKNGETKSLSGRNAFIQTSPNTYDEVCVEFQSPPEFWQSNLVCNKIVCQQGTSGGYGTAPVIAAQSQTQTQTQTQSGQQPQGPTTGWARI